MDIDFEKEINDYPDRCVSTIGLVKNVSKRSGISEYKVKEKLEDFLPIAFSLGISKFRTSEIFLSKREKNCCPVYKGSYISHLIIRHEQ